MVKNILSPLFRKMPTGVFRAISPNLEEQMKQVNLETTNLVSQGIRSREAIKNSITQRNPSISERVVDCVLSGHNELV